MIFAWIIVGLIAAAGITSLIGGIWTWHRAGDDDRSVIGFGLVLFFMLEIIACGVALGITTL